MAGSARITLGEQVARIPTATRATVEAAMQVVRLAAPDAEEIAYQSQPPRSSSAMWKIVRYARNGAPVVGIGTYAAYATLFFYRGRELDNADGLLKGSGKDSRYLTLHEPGDAARPEVTRLVRQAFELDGPIGFGGSSR